MPSPFPGMDPWLEHPAVFPDFHTRLLTGFSEALNAVLPPPFFAALSTRVWLEESERRVEPDVDVLRPPEATPSAGAATVLLPATELLEIVAERAPDEEMTETVVEIHAAGGERLVTSVEMLSISNKTPGSGGRDLFRAKQQELLVSGVHLVEIDLLRGGTHATLIPERMLRERAGPFDYHVCIHRVERRNAYQVAPIRLPQRLPVIPVPLTAEVPDVTVDLQALFDRCYDVGLYGRRVRYREWQPIPPLSEEQARWAEQVLRERGV
jgi:hypothetical protein